MKFLKDESGIPLPLGEKMFRILGAIFLVLIAIMAIIPLYLILIGSFSSERSVIVDGFQFIPSSFSLEAYNLAFKNPEDLLSAYFISVARVVIGTSTGLFITAMTGYVLSRKDFKYRNKFSFGIYFTSVFSGGLVPWYLMISTTLDLRDNFLVLILPMMLNVFNIIIAKTFMGQIPFEVIEACKIDGASEFYTFLKVVMPMAKSGLTTIGVFITLAYWNDFFQAMLFVTEESLFPLQYYLYRMVNTAEALSRVAELTGMALPDMPKETLKLAMTVLTVLPIMCVYPFFQKYIVGGIAVGSVKG